MVSPSDPGATGGPPQATGSASAVNPTSPESVFATMLETLVPPEPNEPNEYAVRLPRDAVALFTHAYLVNLGFKLVRCLRLEHALGTAESGWAMLDLDAKTTPAVASSASSATNRLPAGWNRIDKDGGIAMVYEHAQSEGNDIIVFTRQPFKRVRYTDGVPEEAALIEAAVYPRSEGKARPGTFVPEAQTFVTLPIQDVLNKNRMPWKLSTGGRDTTRGLGGLFSGASSPLREHDTSAAQTPAAQLIQRLQAYIVQELVPQLQLPGYERLSHYGVQWPSYSQQGSSELCTANENKEHRFTLLGGDYYQRTDPEQRAAFDSKVDKKDSAGDADADGNDQPDDNSKKEHSAGAAPMQRQESESGSSSRSSALDRDWQRVSVDGSTTLPQSPRLAADGPRDEPKATAQGSEPATLTSADDHSAHTRTLAVPPVSADTGPSPPPADKSQRAQLQQDLAAEAAKSERPPHLQPGFAQQAAEQHASRLAQPQQQQPDPDRHFHIPGFDDEHQMRHSLQQPLRHPAPGADTGSSGHSDLHPPHLGPYDPLRPSLAGHPGGIGGVGGVGGLREPGSYSGMHPTYGDPVFNRLRPQHQQDPSAFSPHIPPGARYDDPTGPTEDEMGGMPGFGGPGVPRGPWGPGGPGGPGGGGGFGGNFGGFGGGGLGGGFNGFI